MSTLPPATGFLVSAGPDAVFNPVPMFASLGALTEVEDNASGTRLCATLVHSGTPQGAVARRRGATLVLAGELHNGDQLRSLLPGDDIPDTDAGLVLALVELYGVHAFRLLNGRFAAFGLLGRRALLATDHAGSVPLYLNAVRGRITAATEAKAITVTTRHPMPALGRQIHALPGIRQVPAGSVLELDVGSGAGTVHRTWTPPLSRRILPEDEAVELVRRTLDHAVRSRIGSCTPLVVISGGIDSSSVAALAAQAVRGPIDTVSMGTTDNNEFAEARVVAEHLRSVHSELTVSTEDLLRRLPHAIWASESTDPDIIEYLLPLTTLYLGLNGPGRRILTGYGADIPLGGMHREDRLPELDTAVARDMATFDGLNEMTPVLSAIGGHWSTHPFWDREVLDALTGLEAGLKRRYGRDKWVLRAAMGDMLPLPTVLRPKLGVHEGSGTTTGFTALLTGAGLPADRVHQAKHLVVRELFGQVVAEGRHPDEVDLMAVVDEVARNHFQPVA
ncbi:hypothetical protein Lesp02_74310 [Lentzea sp. NBRC 105346]|uniref:asparagine synthase-related protein n=1 Tax=Lentzea sp. NBRC 105346 TaxID=3032205 RepID=UPI00249FD2BE|nr:asparagine synthase-related protein [Lentzea sp. NBRC 105346]GLZ35244.1 hypothetical protein Lesp02_74310 [Lentzea sp. NBRC 105346]